MYLDFSFRYWVLLQLTLNLNILLQSGFIALGLIFVLDLVMRYNTNWCRARKDLIALGLDQYVINSIGDVFHSLLLIIAL